MRAEHWFLGAGIALCLFALWAVARQDLIRLTRPAHRVIGVVCGHRTIRDDSGLNYAAIFRFSDEAGSHEVVDSLLHQRPIPPVGAMVGLIYPAGRPDLARPPRRPLWLMVYAFFIVSLGLLVARLLGFLPD